MRRMVKESLLKFDATPLLKALAWKAISATLTE